MDCTQQEHTHSPTSTATNSQALWIYFRQRWTLRPTIRQIIISVGTAVAISFAGLVTLSLLGRLAGPTTVSEYLLVRRTGLWAQSGVLLGLGVALPRFVAYCTEGQTARIRYFWSALLITVVLSLTFAAMLQSAPVTFAKWLFGSPRLSYLILPLAMVVIAQAAHIIVFGFYRGCLSMYQANLLQFINVGAIPLIVTAVLWPRASAALIMNVTAVITLFIAGIFVYPMISGYTAFSMGCVRELVSYGAARVPGDFGTSAMLSIGPIVAAHYVPITQVAYLLLGIGLLNVVGTSVNPVNQVLLSKVSTQLAQGRQAEARNQIRHMLAAAIEISFYICVQLLIFADVVLRIWMGPQFQEHMLLIRVLLAAIPFYLFYTALRSIIDAGDLKAHNAKNVSISVGTFLLLLTVAVTLPSSILTEGIAAALLLAMLVLAMLTARTVTRLYTFEMQFRNSIPALAITVLLGFMALVMRSFHIQIGAGIFFLVQAIGAIVFVIALRRVRSPWFVFLCSNFVRPPVSR